jgi:hypothetical protein
MAYSAPASLLSLINCKVSSICCVAVPAMIGLSLKPASSSAFRWLEINSFLSSLRRKMASPVLPRITNPLMPPLTRKRECSVWVFKSSGGVTGSWFEVPSAAKNVATGTYVDRSQIELNWCLLMCSSRICRQVAESSCS